MEERGREGDRRCAAANISNSLTGRGVNWRKDTHETAVGFVKSRLSIQCESGGNHTGERKYIVLGL